MEWNSSDEQYRDEYNLIPSRTEKVNNILTCIQDSVLGSSALNFVVLAEQTLNVCNIIDG